MAHHNTVFSQLLKLVPRHQFETLAREHHQGRRLRKLDRWSQFVALAMGQLGARRSLRDVVTNLEAQGAKRYHLGCSSVSRSSLARVNARQPHTLYEALFAKLYTRCQGLAPRHRFRFKHPLYSLDSTLIDLSLSVFPWAHFCLGKAALKLHVGLDHRGYLPAFAAITHGHRSDLEVARTLAFPKGSIVVCDKGYMDYAWFKALTDKGIFFVIRPRKNACYRVRTRQALTPSSGVSSDQIVQFTGTKPSAIELAALRRVGYRDPATGKHYVFITNAFHLAAKTIAEIYKERWQIELFFKWIKQNLKIKAFYGTSKNAILTQIWVALCVYLLLAYLKFSARLGGSLQQLLRLLQLNLFVRRDLMALLRGDPPLPKPSSPQHQLLLA